MSAPLAAGAQGALAGGLAVLVLDEMAKHIPALQAALGDVLDPHAKLLAENERVLREIARLLRDDVRTWQVMTLSQTIPLVIPNYKRQFLLLTAATTCKIDVTIPGVGTVPVMTVNGANTYTWTLPPGTEILLDSTDPNGGPVNWLVSESDVPFGTQRM